MKKKLTDRFIASLKAPEVGRLDITDEGAAGLVLRVTSNGVFSWVVRYTPSGNKQKRATIGTYTKSDAKLGMTLSDARHRAAEIVAAARRGVDLPLQEAEARNAEILRQGQPKTVGELLDKYVEEYCKNNQRKWLETQRMFENHVIPEIGALPLSDLRRADVVGVLDLMQNEKNLKAQVNRVRTACIAALNWAVEREFIELNPASPIKARKVEEPRQRTLTDTELSKIWQVADRLSYPSGPLIKLLILTGQRRDEVRGMRWSEIVPENQFDFATKTGRDDGYAWVLSKDRNKSKREHILPVTGAMKEILDSLPRVNDAPDAPVFSVTGKAPYNGMRRLKEIIDRESGVTSWTFHDLRRTMRSNLAYRNVSNDVSERILNHSIERLQATYNTYSYWSEMRSALEVWAGWVTSKICNMTENVVVLRGGK